ncbi:MAG TPA: PLP-dependent aminotransferase family protein [Candidatus Fermentibacter sp.]|nr:PLP-dependent aminotransferase family protein [Candidatus Fermentibacter sp.]
MDRELLFSARARSMKRSVIRELLKLTSNPEIISFAGGLPAPETFPVAEVAMATNKVLWEESDKALQYGSTEGDMRLRQDLADLMKQDGTPADPSNILVTVASQQGLDFVGKIFLDPGDTCVVGLPTYLGALQAFRSYQGRPVGVPLDDHGMRPDMLADIIRRLESENRRPKFIYVIPDFQNPAGVTIPENRRREIIRIAREGGYLIIEDTPYRQLRYTGKHEPTFQSMAPDSVLSLYTFSKILMPGFRLGWAYGPDWIIDKMVMAKQGTDLCSPPFNQAIAHHVMASGALQKGLVKTIELYARRRELMLSCLDNHLLDVPGIKWTKPEGGLFLWLTLPEGMDSDDMFHAAIQEKVAYVPGSAFYPDEDDHRSMRLNFSYASEMQICEGVKRLSALIHKQG